MASGANFDAEIRLDIGPFIASIKRAQSEVTKLSQQIDSLNKKTVAPRVAVAGGNAQLGAASTSVGSGSQQRMAAAKEEIAVQNDLIKAEDARGKKASRSANEMERNLARERYALYDVAATYTILAAAASGTLLAMSKSAIDYERTFANVARTTEFNSIKAGQAVENMKYELKALASEIPVAFSQITEIATIGNQLGIAQGALTSFTETVAKFSATTGVSVESTAMSFGRIGELLTVAPENFEKLGSAIAFAGVNAVATEEQILSVTKEIATTAKMAKFTAEDIVGLSTALASLGIAPEAARGSIIRSFAGINAAISEGGDKLNAYATISGMTAAEFAGTWQKNGEKAFNAFLAGLQRLSDDGKNLDSVLRGIGMKNVRDIQTIQKLGDNYQVYADSLADANKGFSEGTFLGESYGKIQDTVAAKLEVLSNSFTNLLDTLGQSVISDFFKGLLDNLNAFLVSLNEIARSPVGRFLSTVALVLGAFATALFAVNAASALAKASLRAFSVAQTSLIGSTAKTTLTMRAFDAMLLKTNASARLSEAAMGRLKVGIGALGTLITGIKWLAIIQAATLALSELASAFTPVQDKAESLIGGFSGLQEALSADYTDALSKFGTDASVAAAILKEEVDGATVALDSNEESAKKAAEAIEGMALLTGGASNSIDSTTDSLKTQNVVLGENYDAWLKQKIAQSPAFQRIAQDQSTVDYLKAVGFNINSANQAAKDSNLESYMQGLIDKGKELNLNTPAILKPDFWNGFDFPLQQITNLLNGARNESYFLGSNLEDASRVSLDGTAADLEKMGKESKGAAKSLRTVVDYANDLRTIFSRAFEIKFGRRESLDQIASGWNNIAEKAESAKDEIKKANAEIAELAADRSILAYQLTVAERYGDEQRAAVIRAKIAKIDNNVADKKKDISDATAELTKSTQGNTDSAIENREVLRDQVQSYASYIEMLSKTGLKGKELRDRVKELKEEFRKNATEAGFSNEALKPYLKTFDDMSETIKKTPRNVDIEFKANVSPAQQAVNEFLSKLKNTSGTLRIYTDLDKTRLIEAAQNQLSYLQQDRAILTRYNKPTKLIDEQISVARAHLAKVLAMSNGGLVKGPGGSTSDSIPAMLSNGEFVVKASAVGAYGVDFLNAINQQKVGSFTSNSLSVGGASTSTVAYLSPEDRALLRAVIDRPVNLYTENAKIASSANAGNVVLAQRGTN